MGSAYITTGKHVKIDLNRRTYEVNLVGPPNKGKAGAKGAPKPATKQAEAPKKPETKEAPTKADTAEQKKPDKKTLPEDSAKAIPKDVVNATTVAKAKPEEPKKEEPKKKAPEKEKPKVEEKKEPAKKEEAKKPETKESGAKDAKKDAKKEPTKEDILAQALKDVGKEAASSAGKGKEGQKGSGNAVADALASLGAGSGRGTAGDGTAEDGPGEGESSGSLADYYGTQVKDAIRPNWRFPRVSATILMATVELRVNQSGEILSARIINGSGRHDYDASVMRAIEETKRLPRLPETLSATLVINFNSMDLQ